MEIQKKRIITNLSHTYSYSYSVTVWPYVFDPGGPYPTGIKRGKVDGSILINVEVLENEHNYNDLQFKHPPNCHR